MPFSIRCCIAWKILFRSKRLNLCALENNYLFIKWTFSIIMNFHARTDSIEDWDFLMWCLCLYMYRREKNHRVSMPYSNNLWIYFFLVSKIVCSDLWNIVITRFLLSIFRLHLDPIAHEHAYEPSHWLCCTILAEADKNTWAKAI